jgi:hypothetical protein
MTFPLSFCPGGEETLERLRRLYAERDGGLVCASMAVPSSALERFAATHPEGGCGYPDPAGRVAFWEELLAERAAIRDDSMPAAYLSEMDQGLYGGLVGGEVRFTCDPATGWISSMLPPVLSDWSGFDSLRFTTDHDWWRRYASQLEAFAAGARGKFGISHFILINGLNFLFELVGATEAYTMLIDSPDEVRRAFELSHEINAAVQKTFFERTERIDGGTCGYAVQWLPGRVISESVDPFHMTSVEYFEEWGRGVLERIFAEFDGGVTHIHANGRHLLGAVSAVKGLKALLLGDDRGFDPAFEFLAEARSRVGDLPLICFAPYERFAAALESGKLAGGVFYQVTGVPDAETANRCMDAVRKYRA